MAAQTERLAIGSEVLDVRAVAFDKDGTLFDSVRFWACIDKLRKEEFMETAGDEYADEWSAMMGFQQPDGVDNNGVLAVATMAEEILLTAGLLYRCKGWPWPECKRKANEIFAAADRKLDLHQAFHAKENVPAVFHDLHAGGIATGIMTSDGFHRTSALMRMLQIDGLLDFVITPEQVSKGKPDPEMIGLACSMLNIPAGELVLIGDSAVDVQMAKSGGSVAVGLITYDGSERELAHADILIRSLSEIRICRESCFSSLNGS